MWTRPQQLKKPTVFIIQKESYSFLSTTFFYTKGVNSIDHRNSSTTAYKNSLKSFEIENIEAMNVEAVKTKYHLLSFTDTTSLKMLNVKWDVCIWQGVIFSYIM